MAKLNGKKIYFSISCEKMEKVWISNFKKEMIFD